MKKKTALALLLALCLLWQTGCTSRRNLSASVPPEPSSSEASSEEPAPEPSLEEEPAPEPSSEEEPEPEPEPSSAEPDNRPALSMTADVPALESKESELVTWGPGLQQDPATGRSVSCEALQKQYGAFGAYFIGPADSNTVTITFDQGYENGYTAKILDTLKEKNVKAVFFLTGHYVRTEHELVQRMIDEGHILGNHSDRHKVYCHDLTVEESIEDAMTMQNILRDEFGYEMRLFRFPEGAFSEQSLQLMQELGYHSVFWSFAYADWDPNNQPEPSAALERVTKYLHPGEIMLLHSVSATNAAILGDVIDAARAKGFTVGPFEGLG